MFSHIEVDISRFSVIRRGSNHSRYPCFQKASGPEHIIRHVVIAVAEPVEVQEQEGIAHSRAPAATTAKNGGDWRQGTGKR